MSGLIDLDAIAGAKATHKFARLSASKARVVLNLIREEDLSPARDQLRFCERGAAEVVSKVLESAVANATNNEQLDVDELYVAECWADEGPVLKRWRPRARGRATRIHKQTCHITVVVAQLSTDELEQREARLAASGGTTAAASRAARVAASRGDADSGDPDSGEPVSGDPVSGDPNSDNTDANLEEADGATVSDIDPNGADAGVTDEIASDNTEDAVAEDATAAAEASGADADDAVQTEKDS